MNFQFNYAYRIITIKSTGFYYTWATTAKAKTTAKNFMFEVQKVKEENHKFDPEFSPLLYMSS
jgi:hypothetical protein